MVWCLTPLNTDQKLIATELVDRVPPSCSQTDSPAGIAIQAPLTLGGTFSVLSLACGLDRLPGFVRRLPRVRRWVGCKIIPYHARMLAQEAEARVAA